MLDYQNYRTETFRTYSLQHSPFSGESNVYTKGEGNAYYYFIFPNFTLNILPGRLQTNLIVPGTHEVTTVHFDYYYDDIGSPSALNMIAEDIAGADAIQQEDIEICELVQKGLLSKAYRQGRFSVKREEGVYHFQNLLKSAFTRR
jgi:choline monooxygenase